MPIANVFNMAGEKIGEIELSEAIFGIEPNKNVLHDCVKNHLANCRQGTQSALTKGEVSYTTRKPWRQKGTGRARAGYAGSPVWYHGGVAFAPKPRDYSYTLNRKVKRLALKSALSSKAAESEIVVIDGLKMDEIKTKAFKGFLTKLGVEGKALVVTENVDENVVKSARNIEGVTTTTATILSPYMILTSGKMIVDKAALAKIEEVFIKKYAFEVAKDANKIEIKKAIEEIFGVTVIKVTTLNVKSKAKRTGAYPMGKTASWKKAVVKLSADSKNIELFEGMA